MLLFVKYIQSITIPLLILQAVYNLLLDVYEDFNSIILVDLFYYFRVHFEFTVWLLI